MYKFGLLKGFTRYEDNEEQLKIFSKSEAGFAEYENKYAHINKIQLCKRKDKEYTITEFIERTKEENPYEVLLDLFYRKKVIEHANVNKRQ